MYFSIVAPVEVTRALRHDIEIRERVGYLHTRAAAALEWLDGMLERTAPCPGCGLGGFNGTCKSCSYCTRSARGRRVEHAVDALQPRVVGRSTGRMRIHDDLTASAIETFTMGSILAVS